MNEHMNEHMNDDFADEKQTDDSLHCVPKHICVLKPVCHCLTAHLRWGCQLCLLLKVSWTKGSSGGGGGG